jgi:hypothetical protein
MIRGVKTGMRVTDRHKTDIGTVIDRYGRGRNRTAVVKWDESSDPPEAWPVSCLFLVATSASEVEVITDETTRGKVVQLFDALKGALSKE